MRLGAPGVWSAWWLVLGASCAPAGSPSSGLPVVVTCTSCHGGANPAPPGSLAGDVAPSALGVGAHQVHLRDTAIRAALPCDACHLVPATVDAPGHVDGQVTVTFGALARRDGASPKWERAAARCDGVYCHGATLPGGLATAPAWTYLVEPDPARPEHCGDCHGAPPPAPHPTAAAAPAGCRPCHATTVGADGVIDLAGGRHLDGQVDLTPDEPSACGLCHPVPGLSGAHRAHYGLTGPPAVAYGDLRTHEELGPDGGHYAFGCGHCHPVDPARHLDGIVQVELGDGPPGSLKARHAPGAAYTRTGTAPDGTCQGVYCHSSGQAEPAFVETPPWSGGNPLGCDGCHGNPPRYPSGGPGSPTANTHLTTNINGYSYGHFTWHDMRTTTTVEGSGRHGVHDADNDGAAPMTCQTCHDATVDPAQTGPSGFYYLDTSGDYSLPGATAPFSCGAAGCHTGKPGEQPAGAGRVRPGRHVNGVRDVVFDPRTAPPETGLPTRSALPTRAYWIADVRVSTTPPADGGFDDSADPSRPARTLSLHLANAAYDPVAKTCSSVACHLKAYAGTPKQAWGQFPVNVCGPCHVAP
jgi:predicted CxxxxCH...CXXCH cytochrome family protein